MQEPPLETHRRDGLFFKYSTRELSLSRPFLGHSTETPRPYLQLCEKIGKGLRGRRAEQSERHSEWEQGRSSNTWGTAREKGESGQQDIKRRSSNDAGNRGAAFWTKAATDKSMTLSSFNSAETNKHHTQAMGRRLTREQH